ncbi:MAG: RsmE family RNA methyltransferase [Bacilli bacterium]|nr:RsmE family RNA methyltransferase [Bacilli bacterium]MDD4718594.1 RsmE family RNA methyltransferase [Bacilli bacterium]
MQRYFAISKSNNNLILNNDDFYHIKTVMRMKENDQIEVVYDKILYLCSLGNFDLKEVIIVKELEHNIDNRVDITLIIPLLKEAKMDLILQKATELGVNKIIPVVMERSIINIDENKFNKKRERWNRICKEASEQSKRIDVPIITDLKKLKDLDKLEGIKIVCSTSKDIISLKMCLKKSSKYDKINIVVGPEGGITENEEKTLINLGFERITLGNRILRVETVPMVILSIINYEFME